MIRNNNSEIETVDLKWILTDPFFDIRGMIIRL